MRQADEIWQAALGEMALQITRATFETWLKPTEAIGWEGDCLVVGVANEFTRDWLENRLRMTIERALAGIVGHSVGVQFVVVEVVGAAMSPPLVAELDRPGVVAFKFYRFDPCEQGWLQIPKYHLWFWQPFLGNPAWDTYTFLRSKEKLNEGWGAWKMTSVELIAATVGVSRQAITGVKRWTKGREYWQTGAFDRLEQAGLARLERLGKGKNISYLISCLHDLPLLVPEQVETLPEIVQLKHADFLKRCSIEFKEWKQLELPTLVHD